MKKWKLEHYVIFSLAMVIAMTITVLILTATTDKDFNTIYATWCGIFGGEILCSCLIRIFKLRTNDGLG